MPNKSNFNPETYNRVRQEVQEYLKSPACLQKSSVVFYGKGGEGRSNLLKEMKADFENAGYNTGRPMTLSQKRQRRHQLLRTSDRPVTRYQCNVKEVMTSVTEDCKRDSNVKVFDFTS